MQEGSSETLFEIDIDDRRADYDTLFFNKVLFYIINNIILIYNLYVLIMYYEYNYVIYIRLIN